MEAGDEGIFLDDNLVEGDELDCTDPLVTRYESGLRWSEPYRPDWIKADSFAEYRSGDGDQGTGIESQYGNLVIFKETSMHRVAVQARDIPLSRTDEITPEVGAIAPNSVINVNNILYFLSWKGWMRYDNNVLKKIDEKFDEELQFILRAAGTKVRDAACGYNPSYNELYLNMPMLPTLTHVNNSDTYGRQHDYGQEEIYDHYRKLFGHIYVMNLDKGYATKFGYTTSLIDPSETTLDEDENKKQYYLREVTDVRQLIRKYYTNSLGEMRSGDILPTAYGTLYDRTNINQDGYWHAGLYIETPYDYNDDGTRYYDTDIMMSGRYLNTNYARQQGQDIADIILDGYAFSTTEYPPVLRLPIHVNFLSKFFTGDHETLIKRVRKLLVNMFSKGYITLRGITVPYEDYDERIDNLSFPFAWQQYGYNPSQTNVQPLTNNRVVGTNRSIITMVPQAPDGNWRQHDGTVLQTTNDFLGKPLRFSIEIESEYRTQINAIALHWRPIHKYLS